MTLITADDLKGLAVGEECQIIELLEKCERISKNHVALWLKYHLAESVVCGRGDE